MSYITIAVPNQSDIVTTAKTVSRSLDPDVGGYAAFETLATDANGVEYAVYGTPCSESMAASINYFKTNPQALVDAVNADIALRWIGEPGLTLGQAQVFCDAVLLSEIYGIAAGITGLGLTLL